MIVILIESVKRGTCGDAVRQEFTGKSEPVSYSEREIRRAPSKRLTQ